MSANMRGEEKRRKRKSGSVTKLPSLITPIGGEGEKEGGKGKKDKVPPEGTIY